jgi:L-threonylcarbamoyladenylate synthase
LAQHVVDEFGDDLLVLDGGACRIGIESSIVDCSGSHPMLLRPGVLTRDRIEAAAGEPLLDLDDSAAQAPGHARGALRAAREGASDGDIDASHSFADARQGALEGWR